YPECTLSTVAYSIEDMTPALLTFAIDLVESNMSELYIRSKDGWCREDKEYEMQDITSRYLIAFHNDKPVGMVHFQFVDEETMTDRYAEVAYCFEIQVVPEYQRRGIGAYLIRLLETIGKATQMEKVMLTVFKANKNAIKFYIDQMQYNYDEISPCVCLTRGRASRFDYEILSKPLQPAIRS
ncbi:N-alpha-acetyltransferase 40, partial [Linnemannia elongata]